MGIGVGLVLVTVGAILVFALDVNVPHLHLEVIGWILMIVGVVGAVPLPIWISRRRRIPLEPEGEESTVEERVVEEIRSHDDPLEEVRRYEDPLAEGGPSGGTGL